MTALAIPRPPTAAQVCSQRLCRTFRLNLESGLHMRPCASLVEAVRPYCSEVLIEVNGHKASGNSMLGLLDRPRNNWGPKWYAGYAIAWHREKQIADFPVPKEDAVGMMIASSKELLSGAEGRRMKLSLSPGS